MKHLINFAAGAALALALNLNAAEPKSLGTQKEKASYGVGMNIAKRFKSELMDIDIDAFMRGFKDTLTGANPAVSEAELEQAMTAFIEEISRKSNERAAINKKAGEDFLAKNKTARDVKTLDNGLQYIVLKEGAGAMPKATDTVRVHYRGTLIDGTEFDSSYERNEPTEFPLNGVIRGWTEALQKMKVGSKWKVFIPSDLAYGDEGRPPVIPPASVLTFEIELLEIVKS